MTRRGATLLALAVLATAGACRSRVMKRTRSASEEMSAEILFQLERRADTRHMRLLVRDFTQAHPKPRPVERGYRSYWADVRAPELPDRFRDQLVTALAQHVRVVEGSDASRADVNAVLVGTYSAISRRKLLVSARVVDAETNVVLAATEHTLRR